ncbi:MAG TPA: HAMP domain-containing sensor histidine kinase [Bacteroidia bacterium]|nr:HAMP domain-containing sensor histidine kinase [Bacteroidia bacterium]
MKLRRRIFLYYSATLSLSLLIVGFWSWFELNEHRDIFVQEGVEAALKHDLLYETIEVVLYGGLPAILIGIIVGNFLIGRALRPIGALTDALEKTDASNLSEPHPVPVSGRGDELDRMAIVYNRMRERLALSFTQTRDFTLNASHELKTPLTIMHGTLERTIAREGESKVEGPCAVAMLEEVQRLSAIVGQLSFLASADAGRMPLNREPVALHDLVRDLAEEIAILATGTGISVAVRHCEPVEVSADRMRLRQLLLNLGDNAVKYNEPGGTVELALRRAGREAELTIANTGQALPAERRAQVFDRFFRGDPAHNTSIEGSGLGLSIAKSIVEAHGGRIAYEVLLDGRTQVRVALPVDS